MALEQDGSDWYMICDGCGEYLYPPGGDEAAYYKRKGILLNAAESEGWLYYPEFNIWDENGDVIDTFYDVNFCCSECEDGFYDWACGIDDDDD